MASPGLALADLGIAVDGGEEAVSVSDSFGTPLAQVGGSGRQVILIEGASSGSEEMLGVLGGRGASVVVLTANDFRGA